LHQKQAATERLGWTIALKQVTVKADPANKYRLAVFDCDGKLTRFGISNNLFGAFV